MMASNVSSNHAQGKSEDKPATSVLLNGHAPEDGPVDPFDIEALRSGQALDDYGAEEVMVSLEVRRPGPKEFFRVHPGPDYRLDVPLLAHEVAMHRTFSWVTPRMRPARSEPLVTYRVFV